jgi:hypothetical protein
MKHAFPIVAAIGLSLIALIAVVWHIATTPKAYCGSVPRKYFSGDELHWLDSASGTSHATYHACILRSFTSDDMGLPGDTAVVRIPGVTATEIKARTGWKSAANDCPLGEQDVQQAFGGDLIQRWTALTWDGERAVCAAKQNQPPQEVLVRGETAYDLFTDNNDALASYLG